MDFPINIQEYLPHREPMLMVDEIIKLDDQIVETIFRIYPGNIFVENGFFNEIGLIENAAQTCSAIVGRPHFENNKDKKNYRVEGMISKVDYLSIISLPSVDTVIKTKGEMESIFEIGEVFHCKMSAQTFVKNRLLLEGVFSLLIRP